jgi:hypothetical protein
MGDRMRHLVGLKVLRLSRPVLNYDVQEGPALPTTTVALPSSFGNVYVGEQFSCMLSVNAELGDGGLVMVNVSISIQLPSQEVYPLVHPEENTSSYQLGSNENHQHVVHYEAKEAGVHDLIATINYKTDGKEDFITFRKHYKFTVGPALNVKTKLSQISADLYAIEAQVENVTNGTMVLETTELLPPEGWTTERFETVPTAPLLPKDVWQWAFTVQRDSESDRDVASIGTGKLTLGWRREPLGEKGWLTTGPIKPT